MDKGSRNEDAGAEMAREEEDVMRYRKAREAADYDGKGARC